MTTIAYRFPKLVYEHFSKLLDASSRSDSVTAFRLDLTEMLPLGPIEDAAYVDRELEQQWKRIVGAGKSGRSRLALARSLLRADATSAPDRLKRLISGCSSGEQLKRAVELSAVQGSRFVFDFSELTRLLLVRGTELGVFEDVKWMLWRSACGGPRSYTEFETDPEYRYILEQGEALANRYRDDAVLGNFYRTIADSERQQAELRKRLFAEDDED